MFLEPLKINVNVATKYSATQRLLNDSFLMKNIIGYGVVPAPVTGETLWLFTARGEGLRMFTCKKFK